MFLRFLQLRRQLRQIARDVDLLRTDFLTAAAGDAVPRLLALFYAANRHARVPCQSLRIESNLIILIEHVRNIDALRTVGRAVTACGTRHAFCHLLRLFEQHCLCGVVHRRVRLKNADILLHLLQI